QVGDRSHVNVGHTPGVAPVVSGATSVGPPERAQPGDIFRVDIAAERAQKSDGMAGGICIGPGAGVIPPARWVWPMMAEPSCGPASGIACTRAQTGNAVLGESPPHIGSYPGVGGTNRQIIVIRPVTLIRLPRDKEISGLRR